MAENRSPGYGEGVAGATMRITTYDSIEEGEHKGVVKK
jgi:hypothetical protein